METLNAIWQAIYPYVAGISVTGILSAVIYGCLKGAFSRTISKINVEKIADEATEKGIKKVKEVSFKHSIQPLVESELKKITEQANENVEKELKEVKAQYNRIIDILDKQAAYFDNSIGVAETSKQELKQAIAVAKSPLEDTESVVEISNSTEEQKPQETAKLKVVERRQVRRG